MDVATSLPIRPGQVIERGRKYVSADGVHYVTMASNGNFMLKTVAGDRYLWGLDQQGVDLNRVKAIRMMPDGNLIAIDAEGNVVWSPVGSDAASGSYLTISGGHLHVVAPAKAITWSSTERRAASPAGQKVALPPIPAKCSPRTGFTKCKVIASPRITIHGTARVSDAALNTVASIYTDLTSRLKPAFSKEKLNFVDVLITNGETAVELTRIPGIGDNGRAATGPDSNDVIRGGGDANVTWITEQMICKKGVATRGDNDKIEREFDQVIHEFAHTMSFRFNYIPTINRVFTSHLANNIPADESFPFAVQAWFKTSENDAFFLPQKYEAELGKIFTSKHYYPCPNNFKRP